MKLVVIIIVLFKALAVHSMPAKVVGGIAVGSTEQFPYQTAIFAEYQDDSVSFCSGSILSATHILTCAHCLVGSLRANLFYGSHSLSALDYENYQVVESESYRLHPQYSSQINDIALIELPKAIQFSDFVQPLQLPKFEDSKIDYSGRQLQMASWGFYSNELKLSDELRSVTMEVITASECVTVFPPPLITDSVLCASEMHCPGDSGSMLVDGTVAVGIAAFSLGNCREGNTTPSAFMKVSSFLGFIVENSNLTLS